jgi:type I restriction enzyme, R subunit
VPLKHSTTRLCDETERLAPLEFGLEFGWRTRTDKELALMADLVPLLKRRAGGRNISPRRAEGLFVG